MEQERTIFETEFKWLGVTIYFRIRRISYWIPYGILAFPIVLSVGNFGIGSGWFLGFRKNAGNLWSRPCQPQVFKAM